MVIGLSSNDLMICDRIFKYCIKEERMKINYICGWIKPKNKDLEEWKVRENKELSTQRGSFERIIGKLVSKFKILRIKYRGTIEYIYIITYFILEIFNIDYNFNFVREQILKMNEEEFNHYISTMSCYLGDEIVDVESTQDMIRRIEEEEARDQEESITNYLLDFEEKINSSGNTPSIISHQRQLNEFSLLSPQMIQEIQIDIQDNNNNNNDNSQRNSLRLSNYNLRSDIRRRNR